MIKKILIVILATGFLCLSLKAQNTFRSVTINEILADPNPVIGLPEVEYVELLNNTEETINLEGWSLLGATPSGQSFQSFELSAGQYVILTDDEDVTAFPDLDVIQWGTSGALTNSGETLVLLDDAGNVIDSLVYNNSSGGRSLEQINPLLDAFSFSNYSLSTDDSGGTPGRQNSVFEIDETPPELVELAVNSEFQLMLTFSEPINQNTPDAENFSVSNGIGQPSSINFLSEDMVSLDFSNPFMDRQENTLTINSISDLIGNVLIEQTVTFTYFAPFMPNFRDIVINEIMADPSPESDLPPVEYIELFNASERPINLSGWRVEGATASGRVIQSFILAPQEYVVLVEEGSESDFSGDNIISWGGGGALTNSGETLVLLSDSGLMVDSVAYSSSVDGISFEQVNPFFPCSDFESNFLLSESVNGGTPGFENSVFSDAPDQSPPEVEELNLSGPTQLIITFSEPMDIESILTRDNYSVQSLRILDIKPLSTRVVAIEFESAVSEGQLFTIGISGLMDCTGNEIVPVELLFGLPSPPSFLDLVITEIMADPGLPNSDLPDSEYLEIVNASERLISLDQVMLFDAISETSLPDINLLPGERLIVTSVANSDSFEPFGKTLGVSGFPSLNNSGDEIGLSANGEIIHSVSYDLDWYDDLTRSQGGFSIEMVDENNPCGEDSNWTASLSENGGTPGIINSVNEPNPDSMAPELLGAVSTGSGSLELIFNEIIDPRTSVNQLELDERLRIESISSSRILTNLLEVNFSPELDENTVYELSINSIEDCVGNLSNSSNRADFFLPDLAETSDILLSEILFNPLQDGVDYVEIFNNSSKRFNINGWMIADSIGEDEQLITSQNIILEPFEYLLFTENENSTLNQYPRGNPDRFLEVERLPSLPNAEGSISIIDSSGLQLDFFRYDESFHSEVINNVDGVALERISFDAATNESSNWTSSVASEFFGTPGKRNAQSFESVTSENVITLFVDDTQNRNQNVFNPFEGEEIKVNYNFNTPGNVLTVSVYDVQGRKVRDLVQSQSVGTNGFLEPWDGTDNNGTISRIGYYIMVVEVFNTNGTTDTIRNTLVLASRL